MSTGTTALLFAPRGFEDIELAAFTDILGWTRVVKGVRPVGLVLTGLRRYVKSKHGLTVRTDRLLPDVRPGEFHALIIPGGFSDSGYDEVYHEQVLELIQEVHGNGGILAAMCVGSLALARAGVLSGQRATTYSGSRRRDNLRVLRDCGADAVAERIVVSGRVITNRGPDTAVETAFLLLEMLIGRQDTRRVMRAMMFDRGKR